MKLVSTLREFEGGKYAGNSPTDNGGAQGPAPSFSIIQGEVYLTWCYIQ
eukprot:SAG31_NODE_211_length_20274_cov_40.333482_8_plen_49_part_00